MGRRCCPNVWSHGGWKIGNRMCCRMFFFQLRARQTDDMGRELAKSLLPQPSITERQQGFGCDLRDGTDERSIRWQQTGCKYKAAMNKFSVSW